MDSFRSSRKTQHWDAVQFQTRIDSVEQQLPPLAIRRAVEHRVGEFQTRDDKVAQSAFDHMICSTVAEDSSKKGILLQLRQNATLREA